jgi:hypothetical protein
MLTKWRLLAEILASRAPPGDTRRILLHAFCYPSLIPFSFPFSPVINEANSHIEMRHPIARSVRPAASVVSLHSSFPAEHHIS